MTFLFERAPGISKEVGDWSVTVREVGGMDPQTVIRSTQSWEILVEFEEVEPIYQIKVRKKGYIDVMVVETEAKPEVYQAGQQKMDEIAKTVSAKIQQVIGINVPVTIVPQDSIERSIGKAKRVIDER